MNQEASNLLKITREKVLIPTYITSEIHRIARVAFDLAKKRRNKVTSCEKSNVMEAGVLWREEVQVIKDKKEFQKLSLITC